MEHQTPLCKATAEAWLADTLRRARHFHAKADAATDWTERDRLRACAHSNDEFARMIRREYLEATHA